MLGLLRQPNGLLFAILFPDYCEESGSQLCGYAVGGVIAQRAVDRRVRTARLHHADLRQEHYRTLVGHAVN